MKVKEEKKKTFRGGDRVSDDGDVFGEGLGAAKGGEYRDGDPAVVLPSLGAEELVLGVVAVVKVKLDLLLELDHVDRRRRR